jgi:hypothetical protein
MGPFELFPYEIGFSGSRYKGNLALSRHASTISEMHFWTGRQRHLSGMCRAPRRLTWQWGPSRSYRPEPGRRPASRAVADRRRSY